MFERLWVMALDCKREVGLFVEGFDGFVAGVVSGLVPFGLACSGSVGWYCRDFEVLKEALVN